ncbi:hypothetical protein Taro_041000, partial [Colocasia esculenta]|nr:hypothetical protein [Colocasia esculenta]
IQSHEVALAKLNCLPSNQRKEYEVALVSALRMDQDKEKVLKALAAEKEAVEQMFKEVSIITLVPNTIESCLVAALRTLENSLAVMQMATTTRLVLQRIRSLVI